MTSRPWLYSAFAIGFVMAFSQRANAHAWHQDYGDWSFDYGVYGHAGLELRNVRRKNELVAYEMSFPTMRVDYAPLHCNNSPFSDILSWDKLLPKTAGTNYGVLSVETNWCGHKVCARSYTVGGHEWIEYGIAAVEGNYIIYQAWYLSDDGRILARMYSKGEQCPQRSHTHHPYWRFDFDIRQNTSNSILAHDDDLYGGVPIDKGFGPGMTMYSTETNAQKQPFTHRMWLTRDDISGHGVWVVPGNVNGRDDGIADGFSNRDVTALAYHNSEEQGPWTSHAEGKTELDYLNGENIASQDVVLWYTAHFRHEEPIGYSNPGATCGDPNFPSVFKLRDGENCYDVFGAGPTLFVVQGPTDPSPLPPFDFALKVHSLDGGCGTAPKAGGIARFAAEVQGVPAGDTPKYSWTVSGSGAVAKPPTDAWDLSVQLGSSSGAVNVTATVTLLGVKKTASITYQPQTPDLALVQQIRCRFIGEQVRNSFFNPLLDPLRDFVAQPFSKRELEQMRTFTRLALRDLDRLVGASQFLRRMAPIAPVH